MSKTAQHPAGKVYMTYARPDEKPARQLTAHLQKAGFEVWDPEVQILPGSDWTVELKQALDTADAMVVLLSPSALESRNVQHEIEYALGQERFNGRLIPVMVRETKKFPWIFEHFKMVRYEDARQATREIVEALRSSADAQEKPASR